MKLEIRLKTAQDKNISHQFHVFFKVLSWKDIHTFFKPLPEYDPLSPVQNRVKWDEYQIVEYFENKQILCYFIFLQQWGLTSAHEPKFNQDIYKVVKVYFQNVLEYK